jgi:uncharacterized DUF497 family protein
MHVTWDPRKAADNLRDHGVAFADVATVLDDPFAITIEDSEHGAQRFVTLGADLTGKILVVVYAYVGRRGDPNYFSQRSQSRGETTL